MTAHAGCRPICTSYHAADCPVAHPGVGVLIAHRDEALTRFNKAIAQVHSMRAALTRIKEMRAEEGCDLECAEKMREIAEEALR